MKRQDLTGFQEIHALLGRGTEYDGRLTFQGRVRIDGKFKGEIFGDDILIVGEGADIHAEIEVGSLIVLGGSIWGNIRATHLVELHSPGQVYGDIHAPQLFIDKGVVFEGKCTMKNGRIDPLPADEGESAEGAKVEEQGSSE